MIDVSPSTPGGCSFYTDLRHSYSFKASWTNEPINLVSKCFDGLLSARAWRCCCHGGGLAQQVRARNSHHCSRSADGMQDAPGDRNRSMRGGQSKKKLPRCASSGETGTPRGCARERREAWGPADGKYILWRFPASNEARPCRTPSHAGSCGSGGQSAPAPMSWLSVAPPALRVGSRGACLRVSLRHLRCRLPARSVCLQLLRARYALRTWLPP